MGTDSGFGIMDLSSKSTTKARIRPFGPFFDLSGTSSRYFREKARKMGLFSVAPEGKFGTERQHGDYFGNISALWSIFGPSPEFRTLSLN